MLICKCKLRKSLEEARSTWPITPLSMRSGGLAVYLWQYVFWNCSRQIWYQDLSLTTDWPRTSFSWCVILPFFFIPVHYCTYLVDTWPHGCWEVGQSTTRLGKKFTENRNVNEITSGSRANRKQRGKYVLSELVTVTALTRGESFIKAAHDCYILALP